MFPLPFILGPARNQERLGFYNLENAVVIRRRFIASRVDFIRMRGLKLYLQLIGSS